MLILENVSQSWKDQIKSKSNPVYLLEKVKIGVKIGKKDFTKGKIIVFHSKYRNEIFKKPKTSSKTVFKPIVPEFTIYTKENWHFLRRLPSETDFKCDLCACDIEMFYRLILIELGLQENKLPSR